MGEGEEVEVEVEGKEGGGGSHHYSTLQDFGWGKESGRERSTDRQADRQADKQTDSRFLLPFKKKKIKKCMLQILSPSGRT